uniref:Gamma-2-syntrophin n=1 Tax=Callorhinus ursinus TaxID=34884 RepID=A0A3Q7Q881_CALUR|nr:gamma-2-syntrophin [Callorhinus ursinus]
MQVQDVYGMKEIHQRGSYSDNCQMVFSGTVNTALTPGCRSGCLSPDTPHTLLFRMCSDDTVFTAGEKLTSITNCGHPSDILQLTTNQQWFQGIKQASMWWFRGVKLSAVVGNLIYDDSCLQRTPGESTGTGVCAEEKLRPRQSPGYRVSCGVTRDWAGARTAARPSSGGGSAWAVLAGGGRSAPSHCEPSRNPSPRGARTWSRRGPWMLARAPALSSPGPERGPRRWAAMSTAGPPPPAAPSGRPGRLLEPARTRTGIALLHREGSGSTYDVRLKLTKEVLTIQKQDVVCVGGSSHGTHHRTVTLRREPVGGLGLSIKGGAEHRVPAVISRIFRGHAADQTGMLFVGDAVLQVNGINVEDATHEEVVHLLRNAGDEVTITVEYLRDAPSFLKLPLVEPPVCCRPWAQAPSSPSSPVANEPKYEKRWLDTLSIPLSMARISRYKAGAEKLRSSAFKVLALDGVSTGILQFHTAQESADWLRAVSMNISDLTRQRVRTENKCSSPCDQVVHMGWVSEKLEGTGSCHTFRPKFLALKGSSLHVFSTPPVSMLDWVQAEKTYNLCEVLFKLHKFWLTEDCWLHADLGLGPRSLEDTWPYCFSVLVGHGQSRLFSVELGSELAAWERSFQRATSMEVQRTGSRTYACSWQGETLCFTVDFALGFTCFDSKTKNVLWRFKFSQLKGSSDDGNTRVKLLFQHLDTKQIEVKELEFPDLTAVLHCIHAFLAAKVASVDPTFMDRQSIARKVLLLSTEH